ncbi:conserved exported hypothetical protein [Cupriavidus taiwanensis]|uniref:Uncharacterized protein n=2 Tax=Cupriavidus taiwanensis TaxID=164546 RepID=A0A375IYE9_9BURK|nr:conserved exported hypothetical protein [Cupriavidus taiwanensis]
MLKLQNIPAKAIAIGAAGLSAVPLIAWGYRFWTLPISDTQAAWNNFGTFVGGTVSPLLSLAAFAGLLLTVQQAEATAAQNAAQAQREEESRRAEADATRFQELAESCWSRAFEALNRDGAPARNRLAWLTCARLLLAADNAVARIPVTEAGTLAIALAEKSHWRFRFYDLLNPTSTRSIGINSGFFQQDDSEHRSPIDERSIRVIYDFTKWPPGETDSIDDVAHYSLEEIRDLPGSMAGARLYLAGLPRFRAASVAPLPPDR